SLSNKCAEDKKATNLGRERGKNAVAAIVVTAETIAFSDAFSEPCSVLWEAVGRHHAASQVCSGRIFGYLL
ncbi:MAG: hypothetical protein C4532_05050, partial [Candidatus Abyssobacteria bacterium SURF_17]